MEQVLVLNGLRGATSGDADYNGITIPALGRWMIPGVRSFTTPSSPIIECQLVGTELRIVGKKTGATTLSLVTTAGASQSGTVTVAPMTATDAALLAERTINEVKAAVNEPVLKFDWQDAEVLRAHSGELLSMLASMRTWAGSVVGNSASVFQSTFLKNVILTAKAHPETETLQDVIAILVPTYQSEASFGPSGRQCQPQGGVVFRDLYALARDTDTVLDVLQATVIVVGAIAAAVASIWSGGAAMAGYLATIAAVTTAAAAYLPAYANDPKRLVADFGGAVCRAVQGAGVPIRYQAARNLRDIVIRAAAGTADHTAAQAALASLLTLDQPQYFAKFPADNARFIAAWAVINGDTSAGGTTNPGTSRTVSQQAADMVTRSAGRTGSAAAQTISRQSTLMLSRMAITSRGQSVGALVAQASARSGGGTSAKSAKVAVAAGGTVAAFLLWRFMRGGL